MNNPKAIIAVALCATVCICITVPIVVAMFYPPQTVNEAFRASIFDLLKFIIGVVSGYLLGKGDEAKPPVEPPK